MHGTDPVISPHRGDGGEDRSRTSRLGRACGGPTPSSQRATSPSSPSSCVCGVHCPSSSSPFSLLSSRGTRTPARRLLSAAELARCRVQLHPRGQRTCGARLCDVYSPHPLSPRYGRARRTRSMHVLLRRSDEALQTVGGTKRKGLPAYVQTRGDLRCVQLHAAYRVDGLVARCSTDAADVEECDLLGNAFRSEERRVGKECRS